MRFQEEFLWLIGKELFLNFNDQNQWVLLEKLEAVSQELLFYAKEHFCGVGGSPEWSHYLRPLEVR